MLREVRRFFLGTVNPAAARVYHRLGWRKLAGAEVMANILSGESPEAFLVEYFQKGASDGCGGVSCGSSADNSVASLST